MAEQNQELRKATSVMMEDLRQAGFTESNLSGTVPADGANYTSISFRTPSGVTNGNIIWSAEAIQYQLSDTNANQLERTRGTDTKVVAQDIASVTFSRAVATPHILEVVLVAEKNDLKGHLLTKEADFKVRLRN